MLRMQILAAACGLVMTADVARAELPAPNIQTAKKETLLQAEQAWNGAAYTRYPAGRPQLTMIKLTVAPHSALPWHSHPVPNAGYILSGSLTVQERASGKSITLQAGQAFAKMVQDIHRGMNNGDVPAVILITYAGAQGVPTSVPAKGEPAEY